MPKGYVHLTRNQRCRIKALKQSEKSQKDIAREIGVHPSTISRELRRNARKNGGYDGKKADKKSRKRRTKASVLPRKLTTENIAFIEGQMREAQASPEQISGRTKALCRAKTLGKTTIYRYLKRDYLAGGDLWKCLRRKRKPYKKRAGKIAGAGCIPNRADIAERPEIVEQKSRLGDFEIDTIVGKNHKGFIVSVVDRASKCTGLYLVKNKTADAVNAAILKCIKSMGIQPITLTADNGKEFAKHAYITKKTSAKVYFAKPYASWQRGLNEHTNGLVRQYFPKGTDFTKISQRDVQTVQNRLNNRPRKSLNFKTPWEAAQNSAVS